jgi:cytoskeleton protein RodZ
MSSIGTYLREVRAARGISLEDLARSTRINRRYLEALEAEHFQELPAPVFTKGFIRAYCQALEQSPDEALRRYGEQTGQPAGRGYTAPPPLTSDRGPRSRGPFGVSFLLLVVLGVALFVLTWALRHGPRPDLRGETLGSPTTERSASSAVSSPSSSPVTPSVEPPPGAAATRSVGAPAPLVAPPRAAAPYRLVARATEKTWLRVQTEDGQAVAEEVIPAGEVREWSSNRRFVLTVGNAGGLALELNGQPLPRLGSAGAVVRGIVIPRDGP